jgi:hypothetical protein
MLTALAAAAAPAAINVAANFLTSPKQTRYEKQMRRLADTFMRRANTPYMQTTEAQGAQRQLRRADKKARKRSKAQGFRGGATTEAKLAATAQTNEALAAGTARIASNAGRYRQQQLSSFMSASGAAGRAQANSRQAHQQSIQGITKAAGMASNVFLNDYLDKQE